MRFDEFVHSDEKSFKQGGEYNEKPENTLGRRGWYGSCGSDINYCGSYQSCSNFQKADYIGGEHYHEQNIKECVTGIR